MPTYEYECTECGHRSEKVQRFSDAPLTTCELCGGQLRKIFSSVGVVFKGSGFYKNDSRKTPAESKPAAASTPTPATKSDATAAPAASAAPAAAKPSTSTSTTE